MEKPIEYYWLKRLADVKEALEANNFEVFVAEDASAAKQIVLEEILPKTEAKSVSCGGSLTHNATGLLEALKGR